MQLISILTSLALTATTLAAPGTDLKEAEQIDSTSKAAQAGNWEYCATDFWCDPLTDYYQAGGCYQQADCRNKAKSMDTTNFSCGYFRPYTCWVIIAQITYLMDGLPIPRGDAWRMVDVRSDDLAFVVFTSGSTGRPQGVMHTHNRLTSEHKSYSGLSWLVDPQDVNKLVPIGAVGEIVFESHEPATGYLNDAEETAQTFIRPPVW
ncbi:hypothetical protein G4B84_006070, partial [Aspergillus flavus NRRL3357]